MQAAMKIHLLVYSLPFYPIGFILIAAMQIQPGFAIDKLPYPDTILIARGDTVSDLMGQVNIAFKAKDYQNVIKICTKVLSLDPKLEIAYNYRGYAYTILKDRSKALADYTKLISLNPSSALAYSNRGYIYLDLKNYPKAIADFSRSIDLNPKVSFAYRGRAMALFDTNKIPAAISDFTKAIALAPGFSDNYTRRGLAYRKLGNIQKADRDSQTAERIDRKKQDN